MFKVVASVVCAVTLITAQAQTIEKIILPSPASLVLTVGRWLMQDNRKLYYIEVESRAQTFQQARDEGFRLAVEHAVGSLILSETEVKNHRMERDEIVTYSSGYVDRFEIVQRTEVSGGVILQMRVWVAHSSIANRLLNQSTQAGTVDGERVSAQINTLTLQRTNGDRVLETVLKDFPSRSFDIQLDKTRVVYNSQRRAQLHVAFWIKWNQVYLNSLSETLTQINQRTQCGTWSNQRHCIGAYRVEVVQSGFSKNTKAYFEDSTTENLFKKQIWEKRPSVYLKLLGRQGNVLYQQCYPDMYNVWNYINFNQGNIAILGDKSKWLDTYIDLGDLAVDQLDRIEISIVSGCQ